MSSLAAWRGQLALLAARRRQAASADTLLSADPLLSNLTAYWGFNSSYESGGFEDKRGTAPVVTAEDWGNLPFGISQVAVVPSLVVSDNEALYGKAAVCNTGKSALTALGPIEGLMLGGAPFCIEARIKTKSSLGLNGGPLISKMWFPSEPSSGVFSIDFGFDINTLNYNFSWQPRTGGNPQYFNTHSAIPDDTWIRVAVADDGTLCRIYINENLITSHQSALLNAAPIPAAGSGSTAGLVLFGSVGGFAGSTPRMNSFNGYVDYIKIYKGIAKHTGSTMTAG
jgi:hypothetical protein